MPLRSFGDSLWQALSVFTDPRRRKLHLLVIATALALHLLTHYATFIPALRPIFGPLPYFRLHAIHEAEFLLIVAYAGIVFGLRGGLIALLVTAVSSIPFILTPYVFGLDPRPGEIRDLTIQVLVVLIMGFLIVVLYNAESRRRKAESQAALLLEANAIKNEFLSIASHELRTPLTTLYGFSELLLVRDVPEGQRREWLERIHRESGRLTKILDDLLNVSRIQTGHMAVRKEKLEVPPLFQQLQGYMAASTNRHTLKLDVQASLPPVVADEDKVTQVLVNFLSNAIKYSPRGGQITVSATEDPEQRQVVIGVADQGIGIAPEDQAELFTTFHRIHRPETVGVQGTGLGLYVVKSLVELMGGKVWLKSDLGKGSIFYFTLPMWQSGVVPEEEPALA